MRIAAPPYLLCALPANHPPVAAGPLLSASVPLLVLPAAATAAAAELRRLRLSAVTGGYGAAPLLQHLGFLLHAAEWQQQVEAAAARRVRRLARRLAAFCVSNSWLATARLLLPALAVVGAGEGTGGSSKGPAPVKAGAPGADPEAAAAAAAASSANDSAEEQQEVSELLRRLSRQEEQLEEEGAPQLRPQGPVPSQPAQAAIHLADWFWAGCKMAAGMASMALFLRNYAGLPS